MNKQPAASKEQAPKKEEVEKQNKAVVLKNLCKSELYQPTSKIRIAPGASQSVLDDNWVTLQINAGLAEKVK